MKKHRKFNHIDISKPIERWEIVRFKDIFFYIKGKIPTKLEKEYRENLLPYLSSEYLRENKTSKFVRNSENLIFVNNGELILLWDGSNAGEFFIGKKGILSSTMVKLQPKRKDFDLKFLFYLLKMREFYLKGLTRGTGIPHVDKNVLESLLLPLPPLPEQQKIAEILSTVDKRLELLRSKKEKLERIKKGLMNELLTGQRIVKILES